MKKSNPETARNLRRFDAATKIALEARKVRRATLRTVLTALDDHCMKGCPDCNRGIGSTPKYWHLAQELSVSLHTVLHWIRRGNVPKSMALNIALRYPKLAKVKTLHAE